MKREIKFRCFAGKPGSIIYSHHYASLAYYFDACEGYEQIQFTGFKDKHGNDIYEGDILRSWGMDYNLIHETGKPYELHEIKTNKVFFLFKHYDIVEIIGNIHT